MELVDIPTELTTAATDALTAIIAVAAALYLARGLRNNRWKTTLWLWIFGLLALAAALGAIAHGLKMSNEMQRLLWHPMYLSLSMLVALIVVAVVYDLWGEPMARRILPIMLVIGALFFTITLVLPDNFLFFIIYESAAMLFALGGYLRLVIDRSLDGGPLIALGIFTSIIAAAAQANSTMSFTLVWTFDHNGIYHLVQMVGIVLLSAGQGKTLLSRPGQRP